MHQPLKNWIALHVKCINYLDRLQFTVSPIRFLQNSIYRCLASPLVTSNDVATILYNCTKRFSFNKIKIEIFIKLGNRIADSK